MPRFQVPVRATYIDIVDVEADTPEEAAHIALTRPWDPDQVSHDIDPSLTLAGEPELLTD